MQQIERTPVIAVFLADAAVPDLSVHKPDISAVEGLNGSVGAIMDDRVSGNDGKALRRCDSIGSAAIEVTVSNPDPAAAVEVQHTSGAVSLARCVPCREIGEMQIVTAVCSQDIGIARFCHDAAALGVASLQPEPRNVSNHKLVSVISVYPMPVFSRVQISVALGFCQVVYAVFQSDHTVRSDRFQQFIHRADLENRIRSHTVL